MNCLLRSTSVAPFLLLIRVLRGLRALRPNSTSSAASVPYALTTLELRPVQQLGDSLTTQRLNVFLILEEDAERLLDGLHVQFLPIERHERGHPIQRLRHAG